MGFRSALALSSRESVSSEHSKFRYWMHSKKDDVPGTGFMAWQKASTVRDWDHDCMASLETRVQDVLLFC